MRQRRIDTARELADDRRPPRGTGRPDVAAPRRGHLTGASVLGVQRAAGNRAARRLVHERAPDAHTAPVVQRAPYGLDLPSAQGPYVDEAFRLWTTRKGMKLNAFADALLAQIGVGLAALRVPPISRTFVSGATAIGSFSSRTWTMTVNTAAFSGRRPAPRSLGALTPGEVTEIVGTIYHEARHADQDVMVVRDLLAQGRKVPQVVAATAIPATVVDAVRKAAYPAPLDAAQTAHARRMYEEMYGAHRQFLSFLLTHSAAVEELGRIESTRFPVRAVAPHVAPLATWQTADVRPHVARLAALKQPTPVETALRAQLDEVDAALTAFLAAWTRVAGAKKPRSKDVTALRKAAGKANAAIIGTYLALESEADARRVEQDVTDDFQAKVHP